jgi:hypothetical protein
VRFERQGQSRTKREPDNLEAVLTGGFMTRDDPTIFPGEPSKPFRLWHVDGASEFVAVVAEADSFAEIKKVRRRRDWRYQVTHDGRPIDDRTGFPILRLPGQDLTLPE